MLDIFSGRRWVCRGRRYNHITIRATTDLRYKPILEADQGFEKISRYRADVILLFFQSQMQMIDKDKKTGDKQALEPRR